MAEHRLYCANENLYYPPGSGLYCPKCGMPLVELDKPIPTHMQRVRETIVTSEQPAKRKFPALRFISGLIMLLGVCLIVLSFVLPPTLVTSTRTITNANDISDGAGGPPGPAPIFKDVPNFASTVLAFTVWLVMFSVGIGILASGEMIKMFLSMHDELSSLKLIVQHLGLLLVDNEP
jgi:hypothetical protein